MNVTNNTCTTILQSNHLVIFEDIASRMLYLFWFPGNCIFGIIGNALSLVVMIMVTKENQAFFIQVIVVLNDLFLCTVAFFYNLFIPNFRVPWNLAPAWVHRSKALVIIGSYVTQVGNMFITCSILLVLGASMTRMCALKWPQVYAGLKHRKHAIITGTICLLVGILSSLHDCFRYSMNYCEPMESYYITDRFTPDFHYINLVQAFELTRMFIRVIGLVALTTMAILVSILYKKHSAQHAALTAQHSQQPIDSKMLTKLLLIQAFTLSIGYTPVLILYLVIYFPTWFPAGSIMTMWKLCDFGAAIGMTWNFGFYVAMSKKFRKLLRAVICCKKNVVGMGQSDTAGTANSVKSAPPKISITRAMPRK